MADVSGNFYELLRSLVGLEFNRIIFDYTKCTFMTK